MASLLEIHTMKGTRCSRAKAEMARAVALLMVPTRTSTRSCSTSSRAMLRPISGLNFSSRVTNSMRAPCTPSRLISCRASRNPLRASFPNTAGGPL